MLWASDVMRVAARKEDDVAAARALCSFVAVDLQPQLACSMMCKVRVSVKLTEKPGGGA